MDDLREVPYGVGYYINRTGDVYSKKFKTIRERVALPNSNGYLRVALYCGAVEKKFFVHRLVASAFLPIVAGKNVVNHKDGNKQNNHVSNLEWVTHSENNTHAFRVLHKKHHMSGKFGAMHHASKPVGKYTKCGILVCTYDSISSAAKSNKCLTSGIIGSLKGRAFTYKGHTWKYVDA